MHMPNNGRNDSLTEKNKTLKHLKHIVKQYDKPEHILNIIVQGSENKILLIKIVLINGTVIIIIIIIIIIMTIFMVLSS